MHLKSFHAPRDLIDVVSSQVALGFNPAMLGNRAGGIFVSILAQAVSNFPSSIVASAVRHAKGFFHPVMGRRRGDSTIKLPMQACL